MFCFSTGQGRMWIPWHGISKGRVLVIGQEGILYICGTAHRRLEYVATSYHLLQLGHSNNSLFLIISTLRIFLLLKTFTLIHMLQ